MKKGKKLTMESAAALIILTFLAYFFLGVACDSPPITCLIVSLAFLTLIYLPYRRSLREANLAILTSISTFIALEISFNLGLWINVFIVLMFTPVILILYNNLKYEHKYPLILMGVWIIVWIILAFNVLYREDWILENYLTIPFLILLIVMARWFKLSDLSYSLIFIYMTLHIVGSHYTYAEVPFGFWLQNFFDLGRNHYDRIVHFAFGFLLAYPLREVAIRIGNMKGIWGIYIPIEFVLAFSCIYELIEWIIAVIFGGDLGIAYLGSQGDIWDAQKDMAMAGIGAVLAMLVTACIILYYNSKEYLREIALSFKIKQRRVLGERVLESWIRKKNSRN